MSKQKQKENNKNETLSQRAKSFIYSTITIIVILGFFIVNNSAEEPEKGPYPPGYNPENSSAIETEVMKDPAPDFSLPNTDGKMVKLSDFKGKVVILDFWATWCPPCRKGIPDLVELKNKYKDKIEILGISIDEFTRNSKGEVIPFMKEYKINYPILYGDMNITQLYGGIRAIPTSFVITPDTKIHAMYEGLVPKDAYVKDIESLIKKK